MLSKETIQRILSYLHKTGTGDVPYGEVRKLEAEIIRQVQAGERDAGEERDERDSNESV